MNDRYAMFNQLSPTYKGILFALLGYTCFAGSDFCAKWLTQLYSIYQVITIDSAVACGLLLAFSPWLGGVRDIFRRENLKINGARIALNFLVNILMVYCLTQLPVASVYTFIFTVPFIAALLAMVFYGEAVHRRHWIAIAVGFIGVVIALKPGAAVAPPLFVALLCAVFIAGMFLLTKSLKAPSVFCLGFMPVAGALVLTFPLMLMTWQPLALHDLPLLTLQGAAVAGGLVFVSLAYRMAAPAVVSPFMYTEMIWAIVFGFLIFGDVPDLWMLAGAAVIIASGIYLIETERRA